jgi:glucokinase
MFMAEAGAKQDYVIGVDLGGTKILAGVFDEQANCLGKSKISTKSQRGSEAVIGRIARCIQDAADECDLGLKSIRGIGLGAPGAVNPETGRVIFAPNLAWEDVPLKAELEKELGVPVFLENDANVCFWKMTPTSVRWVSTNQSWSPNRRTWSESFWARALAQG